MQTDREVLNRSDLLKKAGVVSVTSLLGTIAAEALPRAAGANEPLNLHYQNGGGGTGGMHRRPRKPGTCVDVDPGMADMVIITETQPTGCSDEYVGYTVIAWYTMLKPTLDGKDEDGHVHGTFTDTHTTDGNGNELYYYSRRQLTAKVLYFVILQRGE
jgi:hypothetical protein